ncbi:Uncharacterised protein [Candidatus Gugararchaeum adminiculabundum]|nr:Uncharacterised protein [Candidatus Gugararchaeum adminiculabundum]
MNINLSKRFDTLERKVDRLTNLFEDLTLTPEQYAKMMKVDKAVRKGIHKKWRTADELLKRDG